MTLSTHPAPSPALRHIDPGLPVTTPAPDAPAMAAAIDARAMLEGRSLATLVAPGIDAGQVDALQLALRRAGAHVDLIAPSLGAIATPRGSTLMPDGTFTDRCPLDYDAVIVPGGDLSALRADGGAVAFVARAYLHDTPIGLIAEGAGLLRGVPLPGAPKAGGDGGAINSNQTVIRADTACAAFIRALAELLSLREDAGDSAPAPRVSAHA